MKILITGGTGFIGSHLAEYLSAGKTEIYALVRDPQKPKYLPSRGIHILQGDLFHVPALPAGLDCVFHLAGLTKALKTEDYYIANAEGTARFYDALIRQNLAPKVVHLSSLAACGPSWEGRARRESDPAEPVTPYGKSKLQGEREALARANRFSVVIIRVGGVYGPRDIDFFYYIRQIRRGWMPIIGFKERKLSLCYVKDLVRALDLVSRTDVANGEIFNIGDPYPYTLEDFGQAASAALGTKAKKIIIPLPLSYVGASLSELKSRLTGRPTIITRGKYAEYRQAGWVADVAKAGEKLSFATRYPLEEGVRETVLWYQENGWLKCPDS